jgi:hypothetical protein
MKTKKTIVYGLLAVILVLAFTACSGGSGGGQRLTGPTDNLSFTLIDGGYSVRDGKTTEGTVNIPAYYRPNADSDYLPVTEIVGRAFEISRTSITKVNIPSTVTIIGGMAFFYCTYLTSVNIPNSVTTIYGSAFEGCTNIKEITIPASVTAVGSSAFNSWTSSQTINIKGKANRAATIAAGWDEGWDRSCSAQINYGK